MILFEVYATMSEGGEVLSAELKKETGAVEMSVSEAETLGFAGLPDAVKSAAPRLIAVHDSEASYIRHRLENDPSVHEFRMHDVGKS
jgi:hypothetical protein